MNFVMINHIAGELGGKATPDVGSDRDLPSAEIIKISHPLDVEPELRFCISDKGEGSRDKRKSARA